jgi:hypothetical protein
MKLKSLMLRRVSLRLLGVLPLGALAVVMRSGPLAPTRVTWSRSSRVA